MSTSGISGKRYIFSIIERISGGYVYNADTESLAHEISKFLEMNKSLYPEFHKD
jgi:hypothetical protein